MTAEQYEKLMEIQRVKTQDEHGNVIEERKDESVTDPDTSDHVNKRIQKIVQQNGLSVYLSVYGYI